MLRVLCAWSHLPPAIVLHTVLLLKRGNRAINGTEPTHGEATDKIYGLGIKADLDLKHISLILTHATGSQVCVLLQLTKVHGVQDSTHQL